MAAQPRGRGRRPPLGRRRAGAPQAGHDHAVQRFGRIWLLAAGIIVSGLAGGRSDGLTTALFVFGAYTFVFVIKLFSGPPEPRSGS